MDRRTGTPTQGTQTATSTSGSGTGGGGLTDVELRAAPVPVSGSFYPASQPVSIAATVAVSGPLTDTQLRAAAVPISVPTLTKGTQDANGISVQQLKDGGRTTLAMTAEFTHAQTAETLLTMTLSANGAATSTFTSRLITNGKKLRIQSAIIQIELLGSGTTPQRAYLRMRSNAAGATTATSPLQWILPVGVTTAIVKSSNWASIELPDGFELSGNGTATFGFTLETPDWVTSTATGRVKITIIGVEF